MRILLSGSSGFIGVQLKSYLEHAGCEVVPLVRRSGVIHSVAWDPVQEHFKKSDFEGFDAVIHLAGAGIAERLWTKKRKEQLFLSRCRDTWLLAQILSRLDHPPKTVICASATGFFGDRKNEELTEESAQGEGFLADLCVQWEKATDVLLSRGVRVVNARFGVVFSPKGGMLKKLIGLYRLGLGGRLGSGKQWISWISIDDLLGALVHCLKTEAIRGPVNCVAPFPVTQAECAQMLAKKMGRPAFCHVPAWILKMILGEMAKEMILTSQRVKPEKLLETGYTFRYPHLFEAL